VTLTADQKKQIIRVRIENAEQAIRDAEILLDEGSLRGAANRIYYSVFHAVSALALSRDASFKKHSSLLTYFHKEFIKEGVLDRVHGRTVQKAADDRTDADYSDFVNFTTDQITLRLKECRDFIVATKELLDIPKH
jgi:uncharacterized protein (UPF0332 family)